MNDSLKEIIPRLRKQMQRKLKELEKLNEQSTQSRQSVVLDQSRMGRLSRMDAMQAQQMAAETARRRTVEMQQIESAFLRMDRGEYGYCIECEEEINVKRLEYSPAVLTCIYCAK